VVLTLKLCPPPEGLVHGLAKRKHLVQSSHSQRSENSISGTGDDAEWLILLLSQVVCINQGTPSTGAQIADPREIHNYRPACRIAQRLTNSPV